MALILVVEDTYPLRQVMRQTLEAAGHSVVEAEDGVSAMTKYRQHKPDLVITDIIMPERNGVELVAKLRAENPKLPIIAVSGGGRARMLDLLDVAKDVGATLVLSKPLRRTELLAAVQQAVSQGSDHR